MKKKFEDEQINQCTFMPQINSQPKIKNFQKTSEFVQEGIEKYLQRIE